MNSAISSDLELGIYLNLFRGREDYFAQQGDDWYFPVQKALDEFYVQRHLAGDATFGLYVLDRASCCHLICIDIDIPKSDLSKVDLSHPLAKYGYLKDKLDAVQETLSVQLGVPPEAILFEETGGRGYHIWVFFSEAVEGQTAVVFGEVLRRKLNFEIEFFPKQGRLTSTRKYGNLIKLPLGLHRKYGSWSFFFTLSAEGLLPIDSKEENIAHLESRVAVAPEVIDRAVKAFTGELHLREETFISIGDLVPERPQFQGKATLLLSQCTAMHNLWMKAEQGERLSHSEAFHFANVMLSVPSGIEFIHNAMRLSLKEKYDCSKTQNEIEKITPLNPANCITLVRNGICPRYCKEIVRKKNEDPLVSGTSPCSVWLTKEAAKHVANTRDILERIGTPENLKRAFFQLKHYHEYEDALFFDPFDFEHFETRLDANCQVLAMALIKKIEVPFTGYLPVPLPKKLNEEQKLEYRRMSYSTVYDQVPIQAVFNVVAPIVESEFQSTSYGYRWNTDYPAPYRIFEDWRKTYPRFRNGIMAALTRQPDGYHFCCDIKGFYDHIDHRILLEQIRKFVPDTYVYKMIERTVQSYESSENDGRGLPQGPAYARLLANLYLNDFDKFAGQLSAAYFRYVDDIILVFESERDAERGLERIIRRFHDLNLELSQDEAKKASIEPNTDISRVRKTFDKIQYGILEGTRYVEHLAPGAVEDFLDAVGRHSASPITIEQLIQINDVLPSLLYVVTKKSMFPHQLKPKVLSIVEFLVRHNWFYPKRLKTVFYRLLDMEDDTDRLRQLFLSMDPTHKVYFLLSVFRAWQLQGKHNLLLGGLVRDGLEGETGYVWGFAVAIAAKLNVVLDKSDERKLLIHKMAQAEDHFGLLKWLQTINYLNQPDDERVQIRNLVVPNSPDLLKMFLLTTLTNLPTVYVDGVYLCGLLKDSGFLLLPAACALLVTATDRGELFESLLKFVLLPLSFKPLVVSLIKKGIFDLREKPGLAEIQNLQALYCNIPDVELKQAMLGAVSWIMQYNLGCDEEFAKRHRLISRHNECFLFEMVDEKARYDYIELIPEGVLSNHIHTNPDRFRSILDDFGSKGIMPPSTVFYDSSKSELRIEFKTDQRYRVLDPREFSLTPEAIQLACTLASEIYRKAQYFRRITGKAPLISQENLLIDASKSTVVFQSIGRSLCALHHFSGITVGDEETDIAKMISTLLADLLLKNKAEAMEFKKEKTRTGPEAFLNMFINNLGAKEPGHRYSCSRFEYLVEQLTHKPEADVAHYWMALVYLREQLKGSLFRYNSDVITWHGICRALNNHLSSHLRDVCSREALQAFPFRSRVAFMGQGKRQLHTLSRYLLELALYREEFPYAERIDASYSDLVEFLLLYASTCVEIVSLGRTLRSTDTLQSLLSSSVLARKRIKVMADSYETDLDTNDLAALIIPDSKDIVEESVERLSLRQLSMLCLFMCKIEICDDSVEAKKPESMSDETFRRFAHACLVRIPSIEIAAEKVLMEVFSALRLNEDFPRLDMLEQIRNDFSILAYDLKQVRKELGLSRNQGRASGKYFPPDVLCRSLFHRSRLIKEHTLPGCALTNKFPSSRDGYACSWDLRGTFVTNLIIPTEGVNSLMVDLKKGKFFGFKISYLYSGKVMIFWDGAALIVNGFFLAICELLKGSTTASPGVKGLCSVLTYLLGGLELALGGKIVLHDLSHWISWHHQFVKFIGNTFFREKKKEKV